MFFGTVGLEKTRRRKGDNDEHAQENPVVVASILGSGFVLACGGRYASVGEQDGNPATAVERPLT